MSVQTPVPAPAVPPRGGLIEFWRFVRAQVATGAATAVDWLLVTGTIALLGGRSYPLAVALGALAGAGTDFSIKRAWVFEPSGGLWHGQAFRYALVSAASLAWNELLSWAAVDGLHLPAIPGVIGASILVGAAWNYPMHRLFVFRRPAGETPTE